MRSPDGTLFSPLDPHNSLTLRDKRPPKQNMLG